ncbi:MAG: serine hydrolase [Sediminicola sp.]
MGLKNIVSFLFLLFSFSVLPQDMAEYTNSWEGKITDLHAFDLQLEIKDLGLETAIFHISNSKTIVQHPFNGTDTQKLQISLSENFYFEGVLSGDGNEISGFIKSGLLLYHVNLLKSATGSYRGNWKILMVDRLKSPNFYLSVENGAQNVYQAYPIFGDDRFTGTWCDNFQKEHDQIAFTDFKTGLRFKGKLLSDKIQLGIFLGDHPLTQIDLKKSETDWKLGDLHTENKTSILALSDMERLISKDSLPNTHSVLVSKNGELVYENYFNGYDPNIPQDMRSASKSISSAIVGIAKDKKLFDNVGQSIFEFLPEEYQGYRSPLKGEVDLKSLLTMSSGLDAVDFGLERKSLASEDNYQPTPDWTKTILGAPMINGPNTRANYGSANPYLLGVAIDSVVSGPLELFMDLNLFGPLGISNYIIQTDFTGRPYFGGGMYLTPRDMVKFGLLYLHKGNWEGRQILSENWIQDSFRNYRVLENTSDKNGYGYLWWHNTYQVNAQRIASIEARGAGGQYIFILPELQTVVVITSGNYRNGKTQQPEIILEKYILPYLKKGG